MNKLAVVFVILSGLTLVLATSDQTEGNDVDQDVLSFVKTYNHLKESGMLYLILAIGVLVLIILIVGNVCGVYACCHYPKLKRDMEDIMLQMEEGFPSNKEYQSSSEEDSSSCSETVSSGEDTIPQSSYSSVESEAEARQVQSTSSS